jgi:hypothetical protein
VVGCAFAGIADFDAYPRLEIDFGPSTLALSAAIAVVLVAPFALARRRSTR